MRLAERVRVRRVIDEEDALGRVRGLHLALRSAAHAALLPIRGRQPVAARIAEQRAHRGVDELARYVRRESPAAFAADIERAVLASLDDLLALHHNSRERTVSPVEAATLREARQVVQTFVEVLESEQAARRAARRRAKGGW